MEGSKQMHRSCHMNVIPSNATHHTPSIGTRSSQPSSNFANRYGAQNARTRTIPLTTETTACSVLLRPVIGHFSVSFWARIDMATSTINDDIMKPIASAGGRTPW